MEENNEIFRYCSSTTDRICYIFNHYTGCFVQLPISKLDGCYAHAQKAKWLLDYKIWSYLNWILSLKKRKGKRKINFIKG